MTINEAYIKGLNDAENSAIEKFSKALEGEDVGMFNNPKMEELRQRILHGSQPEQGELQLTRNIDDYTLRVLLDQPIDHIAMNSLDLKIVEILEYIKSVNKPRTTNKFAVKIKSLLRDLEVDFIKNYGKLD
jgi:hypothetical protein